MPIQCRLLALRVLSPGLGRDKRNLVVDQHNGSQRHQFTHFTRGEDWNTNASMTRRLVGNGWVAVNCNAAADEVGIVRRAKPTLLPTIQLVVDQEPSARRIRYSRLTLIETLLVAAGRCRKYSNGAVVFDDQQHLTIHINLNVSVPGFPRLRGFCGTNRLELIERKPLSDGPTLVFLKRDERRLGCLIETPINNTSPVAHVGESPLRLFHLRPG